MVTAAPELNGFHKKFAQFLTSSEPNEAGEYRGYCPIHEDVETSKTPSASYQFEEGKFYCFGGCGGMSLKRLADTVREDNDNDPSPGSRRVRSIGDAPSKRAKGTGPLPSDEDLRNWTEALLANPTAFGIMTGKRGLNKESIERFEIGWHRDRFTIPVRDGEGVLVNVRRYNATARQPKDKMLNLTGHGEARIFLPHMLNNNDSVIITEGEMDAIIGQQNGLPTMSHTAGASVWKAEWSPLFEGKIVYICYDVDTAGISGAKKVSHALAKFAKAVYIVKIPLTTKGSDLTNYLVDNGYTGANFRDLMEAARNADDSRHKVAKQDAEPKRVTLESSMSSVHKDQPLEIVVTVAGKVNPVYNLPRKVSFDCDGEFGPSCQKCPMETWGHQRQSGIEKDDPILLEMLESSVNVVNNILKTMIGVPTACKRVEIEAEDRWDVEELVVIPSIDNRDEQIQTPITRRVYNVGEDLHTPVNTVSKLIGFNTSDPKTQKALLQTWESEPVQTNLDKFEMTPELIDQLEIFQVKEGQKPLDKMRKIAEDLEANVTRIYGRPELHMAYDAVWHSAMSFRFDGVLQDKGWLEMIVIGDTRTGKSEAAQRLCDHYNAGILKTCEGATFAGLVGGATTVGNNSWMVTWGIIPLNDRRLVVLDEVSGLVGKNIIEQMSSVRSSGRAEIVKIVTQETSARTRLIWIGNPNDGRTIGAMGDGAIEAIGTLFEKPEDIARFDLATAAASSDVDSALINNTEHKFVKHRYTSKRSSALVAWAWSRKAEDVVWEEGVENCVFRSAEEVGHRYVPEPPLVQVENVRIKLARIAVAIAARVFSTDPTGEQIVVREEHVEAAVELLDLLYGMDSFGYRQFSEDKISESVRAEKNKKEAYDWLLGFDGSDALFGLQQRRGQDFKTRDFPEFAAMGVDEAKIAIKKLSEMGMIEIKPRGMIRMTPALLKVLKVIKQEEKKDR